MAQQCQLRSQHVAALNKSTRCKPKSGNLGDLAALHKNTVSQLVPHVCPEGSVCNVAVETLSSNWQQLGTIDCPHGPKATHDYCADVLTKERMCKKYY